MVAKKKITLNRRGVVSRIVRERGDMLMVTGLGSTTWDAAAAGDHPNNFYLWGGMGGAAVTGLGLARAQPDRRVIVLTGDGEMLMGIGTLATAAVAASPNFAICVIDNQRYGETGMQETHTGHGVDLPGMAAAAGSHPHSDRMLVATAVAATLLRCSRGRLRRASASVISSL